PGVAGVVGAGQLQAAHELGAFVAESGNADRSLGVLDTTPLQATAIPTLRALEADLLCLAGAVGLGEVSSPVVRGTSLASGIIKATTDDLLRIGVVALAVNLILLVIFLRALIAPLYLLASAVLALGATLGLAVLFFQGYLGQDDVTFYVPFAAAVL